MFRVYVGVYVLYLGCYFPLSLMAASKKKNPPVASKTTAHTHTTVYNPAVMFFAEVFSSVRWR